MVWFVSFIASFPGSTKWTRRWTLEPTGYVQLKINEAVSAKWQRLRKSNKRCKKGLIYIFAVWSEHLITCIVNIPPKKNFNIYFKNLIISLVFLMLKKEGSWYAHELFKLEQVQKGNLFRKISSYTNDKLYFQSSTFLKRGVSSGCFKVYFWKTLHLSFQTTKS